MHGKNLFRLAVAAICFSFAGLAAAVDYFMPNGERVKGEMRGSQFILIGKDGKGKLAPDGTYRNATGGPSLMVQKGIIIHGTFQGGVFVAAGDVTGDGKGKTNPGTLKGFNPQPDPPGISKSGKPMNPGEAKGFNLQPDPPAPGKNIAGQKVAPAAK